MDMSKPPVGTLVSAGIIAAMVVVSMASVVFWTIGLLPRLGKRACDTAWERLYDLVVEDYSA